ncbi:MAG: hypothetical protein FD155_2210 [Bacteroidetes bacterium]|nr:MAG: hypothetical protein FD155_2210 [Bacteroidota bacterium]
MGYIKRPISASVYLVHMIKKLVVFFVLSTLFFGAEAQNLEVGAFGGVSYYNGDLNPGMPYNKPEPSFGVLGRYSKGTRWAYRGAFTTGKLSSDGKYARVNTMADSAFTTSISDISVIVEFNFFDYFTGSQKDYVTPYIFGGISYFGTGDNFNQSIGFNRFSIPFGFGFKYSIGKRLGISAEWKMHKALADDLEQDVTFETGSSDPNTNDWFGYTGIGITYKFNLEKRQACNSYNNSQFE